MDQEKFLKSQKQNLQQFLQVSQADKLCEYLSRYTSARLGFIVGVDNLIEMFEEKYYRNLNGGIMEAFGIMLTRDIKIYF